MPAQSSKRLQLFAQKGFVPPPPLLSEEMMSGMSIFRASARVCIAKRAALQFKCIHDSLDEEDVSTAVDEALCLGCVGSNEL